MTLISRLEAANAEQMLINARHDYDTARQYYMGLPDNHPDLERMSWRLWMLEAFVFLGMYRRDRAIAREKK